MHEVTCTVTIKGEVTIPKSVRKQLRLDQTDTVTLVIHDSGCVELRSARPTIASLKGVVPALSGRSSPDFDDLIAEAFELGLLDQESGGGQ